MVVYDTFGKEKRESSLKKVSLTPEFFFSCFLGLLWANSILVDYFKAIFMRIPYLSEIREIVVSSIFAIVLVFALPYIINRINSELVLFYFAVACVYLINYLLFPENKEALDDNLVPFLVKSVPLVFIGFSVDLKKHYKLLYIISVFSIIAKFIYVLIVPNKMVEEGDMSSSYQLLPHVCLVLVTTFSITNVVNVITSLIGVITIFSFGTRGSIVCLLFLVISYFIIMKKNKRSTLFFPISLLLIICVIFFYSYILELLLSIVENMGMSTRIFDKMFAGDFLDSNGRDVIQSRLWKSIKENWFIGYGIAADRTIAGTYAHNLILEFWVSYGVVFGSLVFAIFVISGIRYLQKIRKSKDIDSSLILVLTSSSVIKLFLSGSYLTETFLYLLIGILFYERKQDIDRIINKK